VDGRLRARRVGSRHAVLANRHDRDVLLPTDLVLAEVSVLDVPERLVNDGVRWTLALELEHNETVVVSCSVVCVCVWGEGGGGKN
jgi:hypothetical protein